MIVIDASAAVELVLNTRTGQRVASRVAAPGVTLHAPHLLAVEVAQVVRRYVARGVVEPGRGALALAALSDLGVQRYSHELLLTRIWALRENLSAYDAAYVALAEALDAPLLTLDGGLANAPGHTAHVELIDGPAG